MTYDNGTKASCSGATVSCITEATAALNTQLDDIVERVAGLNRDNIEPSLPPFVSFLIYKAAAIATGRLQNGMEPEANLQRLKVLRKALTTTAQRWLAGGEKFA